MRRISIKKGAPCGTPLLIERYLNGSEVPVLPVCICFYGGIADAPVKTGVSRSSLDICPHAGKMILNFFKANGLFSCENKPFLRPFLVEISGIEPLTS